MFSVLPERLMHRIRMALTIGWVLLIISLFYDPISPVLTDPGNVFSPLRLDLTTCVKMQGVCLQETPYPIGARLFWAAIVPASVFILLVFGHDFWRRICPLSFLSQIPRALGWRGQRLVQQKSWLYRNHLYLQFGLLYLGVCARILFVNSNRWALGFLLIGNDWFGDRSWPSVWGKNLVQLFLSNGISAGVFMVSPGGC